MSRQKQLRKDESREKILIAGTKLFRKMGYAAAGIDAIMKEAGLTHGGFYNHFRSKQDFLIHAFSEAGKRGRVYYRKGVEKLTGMDWVKRITRRYLSTKHRDSEHEGCPFPDIISELNSFPPATKRKIQSVIQLSVNEFEKHLPQDSHMDPTDRAWATLGLLVGCMALSRAVADPKVSEKILNAGRQFAIPEETFKLDTLSEHANSAFKKIFQLIH